MKQEVLKQPWIILLVLPLSVSKLGQDRGHNICSKIKFKLQVLLSPEHDGRVVRNWVDNNIVESVSAPVNGH